MRQKRGFTLMSSRELTSKSAFTLIETLVVISIIGILISIGTYAWGSVGARSRDNTRKTDIARLKNTLEQYAADTRSYPTYDISQGQSRVYAAEWQLEGNPTCAHNNVNKRLTPNFLTTIPKDPRGKYDFSDCNGIPDQKSLYLYLSSPTDAGGPKAGSSATGYALLATLENDRDPGKAPDNQNPIKSSCASKFIFYCTGEVPNDKLDANYVVTGGTSR